MKNRQKAKELLEKASLYGYGKASEVLDMLRDSGLVNYQERTMYFYFDSHDYYVGNDVEDGVYDILDELLKDIDVKDLEELLISEEYLEKKEDEEDEEE